MPNKDVVIALNKIEFSWSKTAKHQAPTLLIDELEIKRGEHLFIQGASGSGKSTLLNIMSGVLTPQLGGVHILGTNLNNLSQAQKDRFRAQHLGIVFQQFNLLPYLSALDNVALALEVSGKKLFSSALQQQTAIFELLEQLGLNQTQANMQANQLSIGQQQRVAVARALIGKPEILIVDEPTSALDSNSRDRFMQQLFKVAAKAKSTIVFVSHDASLKSYFKEVCQLNDINRALNRIGENL